MNGYLGLPAESAAAIEDGWYHTGDLGSQDDEGFLRITGRKREVIRSGGETISPAEVEAAIGPLPASPSSPSSACPTRAGAKSSARPSSSPKAARRRPRRSCGRGSTASPRTSTRAASPSSPPSPARPRPARSARAPARARPRARRPAGGRARSGDGRPRARLRTRLMRGDAVDEDGQVLLDDPLRLQRAAGAVPAGGGPDRVADQAVNQFGVDRVAELA